MAPRAILYAFLVNGGIAIAKSIIAWITGSDTVLAAKIKLKPDIDIDLAVANINELESELKKREPGLKWCFIEPYVTD